jgi:predicted GNAT family acetyltransferase
VHDALHDVRRAIESLVTKRDERRDGFVRVMKKAMNESLGSNADEVEKVLQKQGINRQLAKEALGIAREQGRFTIFSLVDALTRIAQQRVNAGERLEADQQAAGLLALAV